MPDSELNRWWIGGVAITAPLLRLLFRVRTEGAEHVPARGPALLAFNHVSVLDGPCLAIETARLRRREVRFLVAAELFQRVFAGWVLRRFDQIPIRRGEGDAHALDRAIAIVRGGAMAAISPEGRVNEDPSAGLQRIRSGIARIALPAASPIVPVGIWGTQSRWPRPGLRIGRPLRPPLALAYGPPIVPMGQVAAAGDVDELRERVGSAIATQVERAHALADATGVSPSRRR
jgi:1-acyl-sn-glycerol-3-phosphate acyltransferase